MRTITVGKLSSTVKTASVTVPSSKSLLNRALILSAFCEHDVELLCGGYADDTDALLDCLASLGVAVEKTGGGLRVHGNGAIRKNAVLDVRGAGTVARFLVAALAFAGGDYEFHASEQMEKRPMEILRALEDAGVRFQYLKEAGHFPFRMHSEGVTARKFFVGTDESTQYASGILLAAGALRIPVSLSLSGNRTQGSYIGMTLRVLRDFGIDHTRNGSEIHLVPARPAPQTYRVEPDVSGACYFYALSLLCGMRVCVEGVHPDTPQGDAKFLSLLREKGVRVTDTPNGIVADGRNLPVYNGFDEDLHDFSDQALTLAAVALFASSPSIIRNVAHIRLQECDRIRAIVENLTALGARSFCIGDDIFIEPAPLHDAEIKTFGDHRVAMAFALVGLKRGGVTIDDAECCRKTFPDYFELLRQIENPT